MIDDNFNEDEINIRLWNVETDKFEYAHSLEDILENVNRGRSDERTDYDETNWEEGVNKFTEYRVEPESIEQGQCPYCQSMNVTYKPLVDDGSYDNAVYYPAHCSYCEHDYKEVHSLSFCDNIA